jgi:hypothetical protein
MNESTVLQEQAFTKNKQSVLRGKSMKESTVLQACTKNEQSVLQDENTKQENFCMASKNVSFFVAFRFLLMFC